MQHPRRQVLAGQILLHGIQCAIQRFGQHQHAGSATVGAVVHRAMRIVGEIARIPCAKSVQPVVQRPSRDAIIQYGIEHLGEERDRIETHQKSSPHSTSIVPPDKSTLPTKAATKGIRYSRVPMTTSRSFTPLSIRLSTVPSSMPSWLTTLRPIRSDQ